jgi:hypothetical protein
MIEHPKRTEAADSDGARNLATGPAMLHHIDRSASVAAVAI